MSTPEHAGLFDAYLRDDLSQDEKTELTRLLENKDTQQEFAGYVQMSGLLVRAASRMEAENADEAIEAVSKAMPGARPSHVLRQARGRRRRSLMRPWNFIAAAAAAGIVLIAGFVFMFPPIAPDVSVPVARIIETSADNTIERGGISLGAAIDTELLPGDALHAAGEAWVRYPGEGIAVEVMPGAELVFMAPDLLKLEKGSLNCSVNAAELAHSFHVKTPHGIIDVLGTRFRLDVTPSSDGVPGRTVLEVKEGAVKLTRYDGAAITVGTGQYAVAGPEVELAALAIEKPASQVDLLEGENLRATGWRHDLRKEGETVFVKGFTVSRGMLVKGVTSERVRLIKAADFSAGEISFTYQMNKGYWSFMIRDNSDRGNFYEVGFETELNGRHTVRLVVEQAGVRLFVDNIERKREKGFKIEGRLRRALQSPVILRLHVAGQTTLSIANMNIIPE